MAIHRRSFTGGGFIPMTNELTVLLTDADGKSSAFLGLRRGKIIPDGYTLVELIAVMVIVGVLAASAVPSLRKMASTQASMAAAKLLNDLTHARQLAIATGTRTWVVFDTSAQTWTVLSEDPSNPGRLNAAVINDPATGGTFVQTLATGEFSGARIISAGFDGNPEVGFDWLGRPLNSGESSLAAVGTVTLTDNHIIQVAISTGHVTHIAP